MCVCVCVCGGGSKMSRLPFVFCFVVFLFHVSPFKTMDSQSGVRVGASLHR